MFYVILKGRNASLDYINKKLKKSKNWIFPKGLVHGFGQKLAIFLDFYFKEYRPEKCVSNQKKVFYDILDDRNVFLDYKNKKLKKSKNWGFSKGVSPWFWSQIGNFSRFLF